jgi:hypothetical protein
MLRHGCIYQPKELDRSAGNLDESDYHSRTWPVRRNDDFLPAQGLLQVVHLEGHVRDRLDEVGIGRPSQYRCHWMPKGLL